MSTERMTKAEAKASVKDMAGFVEFMEKNGRLLDFNFKAKGVPFHRSWKIEVDFFSILGIGTFSKRS